jgi:MGT family glycosyltransferase
MLAIAASLRENGHRVVVLTGSRFRERAAELGLEFRALGGVADFDDRDVPSYLPDHDKYRGLARAQYDIRTIFVATIPDQYRAVLAAIDGVTPDAILVDAAFAGVGPLLVTPNGIPILAAGVTPLTQLSRDVAPTGMGLLPAPGPLGRLRNRLLNLVARRVLFRPTQQLAERMFAELGQPSIPFFVLDLSAFFARFLQLSPREFDYPRSDLSPNATFVGPVLPAASHVALPEWWGDLDDPRPVIHVSQGTIDNRDFARLVRPTIEALAGEDVLVVVSTGGSATPLGAVPANVRVAEYLPYDLFLPHVDVYVTNGGYGGVQHALSVGVPLVVAGDTEDKPEVAARVEWAGVGVNLRTGTPTADQVRDAVHTVLRQAHYRERAMAMAATMGGYDARATIEQELAAAVAARA